MSNFSLFLEDIDLLINGKIPLIISQPGRLMQPTKFCTISFWRSTGEIGNRLLVHWLRFHANLLFFLSKRLKNLAFLELQIYHHERTQIKRVTSSTTYFFFRFSFDDEPFHHKIFAEEKIYLSSLHFIHKSC